MSFKTFSNKSTYLLTWYWFVILNDGNGQVGFTVSYYNDWMYVCCRLHVSKANFNFSV